MIKYFAKLSLSSKVIDIVMLNEKIARTETQALNWLHKNYSYPFWVQTYKDKSKRKNFAGIGHYYDEDRDAFIAPKTYPSWILDEETCQWTTSVPRPTDWHSGKAYYWDEATLAWVDGQAVKP